MDQRLLLGAVDEGACVRCGIEERRRAGDGSQRAGLRFAPFSARLQGRHLAVAGAQRIIGHLLGVAAGVIAVERVSRKTGLRPGEAKR